MPHVCLLLKTPLKPSLNKSGATKTMHQTYPKTPNPNPKLKIPFPNALS